MFTLSNRHGYCSHYPGYVYIARFSYSTSNIYIYIQYYRLSVERFFDSCNFRRANTNCGLLGRNGCMKKTDTRRGRRSFARRFTFNCCYHYYADRETNQQLTDRDDKIRNR
jgi:hypothetical protein